MQGISKYLFLVIIIFLSFLPSNVNALNSNEFNKLNALLQKKLPKNKITYMKNLYGKPMKDNSLAGFSLNQSYQNKIKEFSFVNNPELRIGIRIITNKNNFIDVICIYTRDNLNAGITFDMEYYKNRLGKPILVNEDEKNWYTIFNNSKNSYLMLGFYTDQIYYVALINKEIIKNN